MKNYIIFILLALVTLSCSNKLDEVSLISLTEDISLDLSQVPSIDGTRLVLVLKTLNEIKCSNAQFTFTLKEDNQKITLDINDLKMEGVCNNTFGQITTPVPLSNDYSNKQIDLIIKSSIVNNGLLEIKDNAYHISFTDPEGFVLKTGWINKINSNSLWGKIYLPSGADQYIGNKILEILELHRDKSESILNGNYGLFTYYDGGISYPVASNNAIKIFLRYEDWDALQKELKTYLDSIPNIVYSLQNDKGQTL